MSKCLWFGWKFLLGIEALIWAHQSTTMVYKLKPIIPTVSVVKLEIRFPLMRLFPAACGLSQFVAKCHPLCRHGDNTIPWDRIDLRSEWPCSQDPIYPRSHARWGEELPTWPGNEATLNMEEHRVTCEGECLVSLIPRPAPHCCVLRVAWEQRT